MDPETVETAEIPETDFAALTDTFEGVDGGEESSLPETVAEPLSTQGSPATPAAPAVTQPASAPAQTEPARTAPPTQQPAETQSATPAAPALPVPSQSQAAAVTPAVAAPVAGQEPQAPAAPAAPPAPTQTPEEHKAQRQRYRDSLVSEFEKAYVIAPEDATLLATEPEKVLPRMAARIVVDTYEAVTQEIYQRLPALVQQVQQTQVANEAAANQFFSEWPALNKPELHEHVVRAAATYRYMNPKATPEAMRRDVGRMVSSLLDGTAPSPNAPVAQAPALAQPHVPVGTTAAGVSSPQRPQEPNSYVELSKRWERLDDED